MVDVAPKVTWQKSAVFHGFARWFFRAFEKCFAEAFQTLTRHQQCLAQVFWPLERLQKVLLRKSYDRQKKWMEWVCDGSKEQDWDGISTLHFIIHKAVPT